LQSTHKAQEWPSLGFFNWWQLALDCELCWRLNRWLQTATDLFAVFSRLAVVEPFQNSTGAAFVGRGH
jgi:hypothetical protein